MKELDLLALPPAALRALVRHGRVPFVATPPTGTIATRIPVPGGKPGQSMEIVLRVPATYAPTSAWPLVISLHGTLGEGGPYLRHWQSLPAATLDQAIILAPSADRGHGWGPTTYGRAQVWAAVEWVADRWRIDPDRVVMEGMSMGGAACKRLGAIWPDRLAACVPRSGPPLRELHDRTYRNLRSIPFLSLAGDRDQLIPAAAFTRERDLAREAGITGEFRILPGRGHETFCERDAEAWAFLLAARRRPPPETLAFASHEDGPSARHHWVEILATRALGNQQMDTNILDETKRDDPILARLRASKDYQEHKRLQAEAKAKGVFLETLVTWLKPREVEAHIDRAANTVVIDSAAFVDRLRLSIDDDLLDLDKPVVVRFQNRELTRATVKRSIAVLLDDCRATGRRDRTWWGAIEVKLP